MGLLHRGQLTCTPVGWLEAGGGGGPIRRRRRTCARRALAAGLSEQRLAAGFSRTFTLDFASLRR